MSDGESRLYSRRERESAATACVRETKTERDSTMYTIYVAVFKREDAAFASRQRFAMNRVGDREIGGLDVFPRFFIGHNVLCLFFPSASAKAKPSL